MPPHHKLIYGAPLSKFKKGTSLKIPFRKYMLPKYGEPVENDDLQFFGIEYARVKGLYDKPRFTEKERLILNPVMEEKEVQTTLTYMALALGFSAPILETAYEALSQPLEVPRPIKDLFAATYPGVKGKSYALIQDVYTSHYAVGEIVYGYWLEANEDVTLDFEEMIGCSMDWCGIEFTILQVAHNMKRGPSEFFCGLTVAKLPEIEESKDCSKLAKAINAIHTSKGLNLAAREKLENTLQRADPQIKLLDSPVLAVIELMCYCCT